jgi:outer membrane protein TolC
MKKYKSTYMKRLLLSGAFIFSFTAWGWAQRIPQVPDSIRKKYEAQYPRAAAADYSNINRDSLFRIYLIQLVTENPEIKVADANVKIAEIDYKKAKTVPLSAVSAGANINEFVISNSAAANFFPKYNLGILIPLDIVAKSRREKQVAQQNMVIQNETRKTTTLQLKTKVLILFEDYKEKKELVRLQKISMEDEYQGYLSAQKDYADGNIEIVDLNRFYQAYLNKQADLVTRERNLNVAILQIEEQIGMDFNVAYEASLTLLKKRK